MLRSDVAYMTPVNIFEGAKFGKQTLIVSDKHVAEKIQMSSFVTGNFGAKSREFHAHTSILDQLHSIMLFTWPILILSFSYD